MIKFYEVPELKKPYMIAAWPGMGNVALGAARYLRKKLRAIPFAEIEPSGFFNPTGVLIKDRIIEKPGLPENKFYYWKGPNHDLVIFIGEAQPALDKDYEFASKVLDVAERFGVKRVYTFAAAPTPIHHTKKPKVWCTATSKELLKGLVKYDVVLMEGGHISGLNGLLLGSAKEREIDGVCLLGEIPYYTTQIENPKSSQAVLEVLIRILDIKVDISEIEVSAKHTEEEIEKLDREARETMSKFVDYFKQAEKPIDSEDIERIRKVFDMYTRIPESAKNKIDQLFSEARKDISRADELKAELDKWGAFGIYEDKFLDLFKRGKRQENH
jgi:hypothetical protein